MPTPFKAAAVHAAPIFMNKAATTERVIQYIKEAKEASVELLVFPETFIPGYPYFINCYPIYAQSAALAEYIEQSVEIFGPEINSIQAACRDYGVCIVLGISERMSGTHTCFNSQVFIENDGTLLGIHRKLQPTGAEKIIWANGGGYTLRTYPSKHGILGGLPCWGNAMNGARQALIQQGEQIHAGAWPALSAMVGLEELADVQIDAMMKNHALTGQCWVIYASNTVDQLCLDWMETKLGKQELIKIGGGISGILHPFNIYLAGPHKGLEQKLVIGEIDLSQLGVIKVFIDSAGHYSRPEVLQNNINNVPIWPDEKNITFPMKKAPPRDKESSSNKTQEGDTAVISHE
ncbi:unnamed protein product [Rotaria sp. Silwood2]|nr:unnamed protein product [Rotaria sp. Silwood2]CAF3895079.1 unnamed protein product [Rotaria sp. Silwood2]